MLRAMKIGWECFRIVWNHENAKEKERREKRRKNKTCLRKGLRREKGFLRRT